MQRKKNPGQSTVEMALMLPILLLVLFGIIDLGYYIYGYSTIYFAARAGTEVASMLPPNTAYLSDTSDPCTSKIYSETEKAVVMFSDFGNSNIAISYPNGSSSRKLGQPIQVRVQYNIQPLTPLFRLVSFGNQGVMTVNVSARRSIEALGDGPISNQALNGIVCK